MKPRIVVLCLCFSVMLGLMSQNAFRVMFYNVENLFDTNDNPDKEDDDWLPKGNQRWTNYRYWEKLKRISAVIDSVGEGYPPAIVGLCEVENDSVLFDLCNRSLLRKHKYRYVITDSKDDRGINVALLYQRDEFKLLKTQEYEPLFLDDSGKNSRNILHATGRVISGDTLDIFVCHFPSRVEGIKRTRPLRMQAAELLRLKVDSVMSVRKKANVVIMGDFNDFPKDISMTEGIKAQSMDAENQTKQLYNLFLGIAENKELGTYKYRGKWQLMDQLIVSGNLLQKKGAIRVKNQEAKIYKADFLLESDDKHGGTKPHRTYVWRKYLGGVSDHLPIYLDLIIGE